MPTVNPKPAGPKGGAQKVPPPPPPPRGRGRGGRGRGSPGVGLPANTAPPPYLGRGAGRGGGPNAAVARVCDRSTHVVFMGVDGAMLVPYERPLQGSQLDGANAHRVYPLKTPSASRKTAQDATRQQLPKAVLEGLLQKDVCWKTRCGSQLVAVPLGQNHCKDPQTDPASTNIDAADLKAALNGRRPTMFAPRTFPEATAVVDFLKRHMDIAEISEVHTLRVTEQSLAGEEPAIVYERSGGTRDAVLDATPFVAAAFLQGERCANVVVVPPASPQNAHENYMLFECGGVLPTQQTGYSRRLQVVHSNGRFSVVFPNDSAAPSHACYEAGCVLKLKGTTAELYVATVEEYGVGVAPDAFPVRVELRQDAKQRTETDRRLAWDAFLGLSDDLCRYLAQFATTRLSPGGGVPPPQTFCMGDLAVAPCADPDCKLRHRFTICMLDASGGCPGGECRYWHGYTEVMRQLAAARSQHVIARADFEGVDVEPHLLARLRVALSLQLLRIRCAASEQLLGAAAKSGTDAQRILAAERLGELVLQYNSVASSFRPNAAMDVSFFYRCCRRLKTPLPLLAAREAVRQECLRGGKFMLVDSSTGSGKSTQLPQYLAECAAEQQRGSGGRKQKLVICVEPRALAAVTLAEFVADDYDDPELRMGMRVAAVTSPKEPLETDCHIVYTTEQAFLGWIKRDQIDLGSGVYAVVLDEAHERSVAGDMLLGILKAEVQRTKSAFRLVVCSATLRMDAFAAYLPGARHIPVGGRSHPVSIQYAGRYDKVRPEANYVRETVNAVIAIVEDPPTLRGSDGEVMRVAKHVLAFLPGAADADKARDLLADYIATQAKVVPAPDNAPTKPASPWKTVRLCTISGRQGVAEQRMAFRTAEVGEQKIIFATPVAETSITIDSVGYVVDCGLTRVLQYDPVRHLTELVVAPVTQSSAVQRAGRAGRTGPGVCIRLYTRTCFTLFEKDKAPAVKTAPLHTVALQLAQTRHSLFSFDWIDKPDKDAVAATLYELTTHGAFADARANEPPTLSPFGQFLLDLDISVPLGRLLYDAARRGSAELLGVAALTAATIQHFPLLFSYQPEKEPEFVLGLRECGQKFEASARGDVLCAVQVVAAVRQEAAQSNAGPAPPTAAAMELFLNQGTVKTILQSQRALYRNAVSSDQINTVGKNTPLPLITPATVAANAHDMQRLLAQCFCLQVAVRRGDKDVRYATIGASTQECLLSNTSFLKLQHAVSLTKRKRRLDFNPNAFPSVCVFGSLPSHSPTELGTISLCVPVEAAWLPPAIREEVQKAQAKQSVALTMVLPSVLLDEWRPAEVSKWLSRKLDGTPCTVTVDYESKLLSVVCRRSVTDVSAVLSQAIQHATVRHRRACFEVALNGFCRLTWGAGCERGEVLRDKDEYVTLHFSGPCEASISCLELDLSEMVEEWSRRWFNRPMLVTVRSGDGGASPATGRWTALVTFASSKDAHDFFERFERADAVHRPFVAVEPYCEQAPLAPAVDATSPLCRIHVRLYVGHADPENIDATVRGQDRFPIEHVAELQRQVRAALPDGVAMESQRQDDSQHLLHMQFVAVNEAAADAALTVLHRIRGTSMHYRSLFFDVAYSVEFPLPSLANKSLQRLLQERVVRMASVAAKTTREDIRCGTFNTHGSRSLLVRCATPGLLPHALQFLRESSAVHVLRLPGASHSQQTNKARALSFQGYRVVQGFNALQKDVNNHIYECQLQFREVDGALCFIGTEAAFARVQSYITAARDICRVECVTLTLPPRLEAARECSQWMGQLMNRCVASGQLVRLIRDRNTIVFLAPPNIVQQAKERPAVAALWKAIDGEENTRYDPSRGNALPDHSAEAANDTEAQGECAICFSELQVVNTRLLCGHHFCTECIAGQFNTEGGAVPEPPIKCVVCGTPIAAGELRLFAPPTGLRRVAELLRTRAVDPATRNLVELKACPNKVCLGVPKVVTFANRKCSGCDLAYCEVCIGNGEVRPWHDGKHYSPADILSDTLVKELPLLPKCPQCSEPFYDFDACFAISCKRGHGFCGFCMADCGRDAHAHVLHCNRNPSRDYFADLSVFYRCRAEDLAARMKTVLLNHAAGSPQLVETLCSKVKSLMSDHWPKAPIEAAEKELMRHKWPSKPSSFAPPPPAPKPADPVAAPDAMKKAQRASAADAAQRVAAELTGLTSQGVSFSSSKRHGASSLTAAVAALRDMGVVDLCDFAEDAVEDTHSVEGAAVQLYAFYDAGGLVETALRSLGRESYSYPEVAPFMRILLCGLQLYQSTEPILAERKVRLSAHQLGQYSAGEMILWDAPTRCDLATKQQSSSGKAHPDEVTFRIQCSMYTRAVFSQNTNVVRVVLPAGARLRVVKVELRVVELQQESDFVFKT